MDRKCILTAVVDEELGAFRLGMPHLGHAGLSLNWLLRACCHRHWWSIAARLGRPPSELIDMRGERMLPSVVAVTVRGSLDRFREDDVVSFDRAVAPSRETGWRSYWCLISSSGATAEVELVTRFAKRSGPSNKDLAAAEVPHELLPYFDGEQAQRTAILKARGRTEKAAAPEPGAPLHSFAVRADTHYNGVGLMYFANFVEPFDQAEHLSLPGGIGGREIVSREIHYYGNVDTDDHLDLDCIPLVTGIAPNPEVKLTSFARRRSDDKIVAVCISVRNAAVGKVASESPYARQSDGLAT